MRKITKGILAAALVLLFAGVFAGAAAAAEVSVAAPGGILIVEDHVVLEDSVVGDPVILEDHVEVVSSVQGADVSRAPGSARAEIAVDGSVFTRFGGKTVTADGTVTVDADAGYYFAQPVNRLPGEGVHKYKRYHVAPQRAVPGPMGEILTAAPQLHDIRGYEAARVVSSADVSAKNGLFVREALIARLEAEPPLLAKAALAPAFIAVRGEISLPAADVKYTYSPTQAGALMSNGPEVSGVIGSAVAPGVLQAFFA